MSQSTQILNGVGRTAEGGLEGDCVLKLVEAVAEVGQGAIGGGEGLAVAAPGGFIGPIRIAVEVGACGPGTFFDEGDADGFHGGEKEGNGENGEGIRQNPTQPRDTWAFPSLQTNGNSRDCCPPGACWRIGGGMKCLQW